eukprot:scaffold12932_cov59-Cylindrotheca_fusiformis.AAC.3
MHLGFLAASNLYYTFSSYKPRSRGPLLGVHLSRNATRYTVDDVQASICVATIHALVSRAFFLLMTQSTDVTDEYCIASVQ